MTNHTPLPWQIHSVNGLPSLVIGSVDEDDGKHTFIKIAECDDPHDARLIVRAVNAYDEMLYVLRWLDWRGGLGPSAHARIERAITKAESNG